MSRNSELQPRIRSVSPGDISPTADELLSGRQKIDPRLASLAVPLLIVWGLSCSPPGGTGGEEPPKSTEQAIQLETQKAVYPTLLPTPTPVPRVESTPTSEPTATAERQDRPIFTILNGEDRGLSPQEKESHQRALFLAEQVIEETRLGFLVKEVTTIKPQIDLDLPRSVRVLFNSITNNGQFYVPNGKTNFSPEGTRISFNPSRPEERQKQVVFHELGHTVDPDLNPYLSNFLSQGDVLALKESVHSLKDTYWRNYFPQDDKVISWVEANYRQKYTFEVGQRFGGSEDLGKRLMLEYREDPQRFDKWSREDKKFIEEMIKRLEGEFFAENFANFALNPLQSSMNDLDLFKDSLKIGAILKVAVARSGT